MENRKHIFSSITKSVVVASYVTLNNLSSVEGFRSTTNAPLAIPFGPDEGRNNGWKPSKQQGNKDWAAIFKAKNQVKKPKYDLGIGKNKPVTFHQGSISHDTSSSTITEEEILGMAGEFIIQHVAVHEIPSPLTRSDDRQSQPILPKMKVLPKVQPERKVQDVLNIHQISLGESSNIGSLLDSKNYNLPVMVPVQDERMKLDVNTIWVEMMLHDELNKLQTVVN
jgi:hypothetical protein